MSTSAVMILRGSQDTSVPVVTIDGGAGVGKGTARKGVAKALGYHGLDSGVLYRAVAYQCHIKGITETPGIVAEALQLKISMIDDGVFLNDRDETRNIRSNTTGRLASLVAPIPEVREALRALQWKMRRKPGLVADGRDQGFLFFNAHRFFLTASLEVQAERDLKRIRESGGDTSYESVLEEIKRRDELDRTRKSNPLRAHPCAIIIDTTYLTPEKVVERILVKLPKELQPA